MSTLSRRRLLAGGAAGGAAVLLGPVAQAVAAAPPPPTPIDDDYAYLQVASAGKLVTIEVYRAALAQRGLLDTDAAALVQAIHDDDVAHKTAVDAILADDAATTADYAVVVPKPAGISQRNLARVAVNLELAIRGALLTGTGDIQDPATRFLLGRVLASDSQHVAILQGLAGRSRTTAGLPSAWALDRVATFLDGYLETADPTAKRFSTTIRRNAR